MRAICCLSCFCCCLFDFVVTVFLRMDWIIQCYQTVVYLTMLLYLQQVYLWDINHPLDYQAIDCSVGKSFVVPPDWL